MRLAREQAAELVVRALGSIERSPGGVALTVGIARPEVTARMLAGPARRARVAVSAPVFLRSDARSWRLSRTRLAGLLQLPQDGARRLAIAGADGRRLLSRALRACGTAAGRRGVRGKR